MRVFSKNLIHYFFLFTIDKFHAFYKPPLIISPTSPFQNSNFMTEEKSEFIQEELLSNNYSKISPNMTTITEIENVPIHHKETIDLIGIKKWMKQYELLQLLQSPHLSQQSKLKLIQQHEIYSTTPYQPTNLFNGLDW